MSASGRLKGGGKMNLFEKMEQLTKALVEIPSVNTTTGERDVAIYIEQYLRNIPYFKEHSDQVIVQKLKNDALDRRNVLAYVKGTKAESSKTIILHGHTDTVGTEDYGILEPFAYHPDELIKEMLKLNLSEEVQLDLESGDYMVGRGACDMKSGVAVFMVLLEYFSNHTDWFEGNLLLSCNPVEENLHTGIIEATKVLNQLKVEKGFDYILAINNDYICPLYPGDPKRYIYMGAVGKLLPCFYIQGKETHVGQCFEGFDASLLAAELVRNINYNPAYLDGYHGEYSLPPSVLKMKDLKASYNVQTAFDAFVYFNVFVHNRSVEEITKLLLTSAKESIQNVLAQMNTCYEAYCKAAQVEYQKIHYDITVYLYEELYKRARKVVPDLEKVLNDYTDQLTSEKVEQREIGMALAKKLLSLLEIKEPAVILFFAPPYCPHNTLRSDSRIYGEIKELVEDRLRKKGLKTETKDYE